MDLPRIDAHSTEVSAAPSVTWQVLIDWVSRNAGDQRTASFARLLGCDPGQASGAPGSEGSTIPGFRVVRSDPPRELALAGGHRFSAYSLDFLVEERPGGNSRLTATTHAAFPGLSGQLYKTAVIRSRAHWLLMRRLIDGLARRAARARLSR